MLKCTWNAQLGQLIHGEPIVVKGDSPTNTAEFRAPDNGVVRGNQSEKTYCLTGECSPDFKRCLTALVPVAS